MSSAIYLARQRFFLLLLSSSVLAIFPLAAAALPQADVYRQAKAGTALVVAVNDPAGTVSFGSGFFVDSHGLLVTNAHVIEDHTKLLVYVRNEAVYESPEVLAVDPDLDLAALRIPSESVASLRLASDLPEEGTEAIAVGYPRITDILQMGLNLHSTVFPVNVSGTVMGRSRTMNRQATFIQTTAGLNSGSSGGPLLRLDTGELVGMVVHTVPYIGQATDRKGALIGNVMLKAGINYSIPATVIRQWLASQHVTLQEGSIRPSTGDKVRTAYSFFSTGHLLHTIAMVMKQDRDLLELAVRHYKTALELEPNAAWISHNLGLAYAALGRWGEALGSYRVALSQAPDDTTLLTEMGDVSQRLKETSLAITFYESALRKDPCFARAHNDLGMIFLESSEWDSAIAAFSRASQCQPASPISAYNWGLALEKKGLLEEALKVWDSYLRRAATIPAREREFVGKITERAMLLQSTLASSSPAVSSGHAARFIDASSPSSIRSQNERPPSPPTSH
ncbi:MAG: trypsin-like peptidase domain-containing protein [Nitrospiraceae bacterium]